MSELKRGLHRESELDPESSVVDDSDMIDGSEEQADQMPRRRFGRRRHGKKKRRRLTLAVLPTLLTLCNGVCGLTAIGIVTSVNLQWDNDQRLLAAGVLIFVGMLFDALDGSAARMTGQASEFGAQLDSLCDVITFGTAPTVIVWHVNQGNALPQKFALAIGVLFTLCVLIRLARFNVETGEDDSHESFDGLPSPAAAGTLAAIVIAMPELQAYAASDLAYGIPEIAEHLVFGSQYFIPLLALLLAYLMVSRIQYPHLFQQLIGGRRAPHQIGQAMFVVLGAVVLHWLALPLMFFYYAFASPVQATIAKRRSRAATGSRPSSIS